MNDFRILFYDNRTSHRSFHLIRQAFYLSYLNFQRYYHYIINGIPVSSIFEQDEETLDAIVNDRISPKLREGATPIAIIENLKVEVQNDFKFSLKQSIGKQNFILSLSHFTISFLNHQKH